MLTTLLESRARSPRRRIALSTSAVAHCLLMIVLVMARARGGSVSDPNDPQVTNLVYVAPEHRRAAPHAPSDSRTPSHPSVALPPNVPSIVVDPEAIGPTVRIEWPNGAIAPSFGREPFTRGDTLAPAVSDVLTAMAVDHPVEIVPGQRPPRYPGVLERAGIAGDVTVQFIVDTTGRVERGSLTILEATHTDFARAVQERLPALRFVPALARGRVVRQLVQQRFHFAVVRR